jgi:hypothetical protein
MDVKSFRTGLSHKLSSMFYIKKARSIERAFL